MTKRHRRPNPLIQEYGDLWVPLVTILVAAVFAAIIIWTLL